MLWLPYTLRNDLWTFWKPPLMWSFVCWIYTYLFFVRSKPYIKIYSVISVIIIFTISAEILVFRHFEGELQLSLTLSVPDVVTWIGLFQKVSCAQNQIVSLDQYLWWVIIGSLENRMNEHMRDQLISLFINIL